MFYPQTVHELWNSSWQTFFLQSYLRTSHNKWWGGVLSHFCSSVGEPPLFVVALAFFFLLTIIASILACNRAWVSYLLACNNSQTNLMSKVYGQHHRHVSGVIEWFCWGSLIDLQLKCLLILHCCESSLPLFSFQSFMLLLMSWASNLFFQLPWSFMVSSPYLYALRASWFLKDQLSTTVKLPGQPLGLLFGKQQVSETAASLQLVLSSCTVTIWWGHSFTICRI